MTLIYSGILAAIIADKLKILKNIYKNTVLIEFKIGI